MITEQERAWAGEHGNAYNRRSPGDEEANYHFFRRATRLSAPHDHHQILELGAGTGANVRALARLYPQCRITAVEINREACEALASSPAKEVLNASVLDVRFNGAFDLVLTKGLLIHIHPDDLPRAYASIHNASCRWILVAEYYNPTPVNVPYRGRNDLLWKRDFAGELLERYADLRLADYGFVYRRDRHPQDDITWFLMEKRP